MSANFVDALLGYELYVLSRGTASREDINKHLEGNKRVSISPRTYQHYKKLMANGFRSYVPINRFDVSQALGKLQLAADRRRYSRHKVETPATISSDGINWHECKIIDISLVGFGIYTLEKFRVRPGSQVWIQMGGYSPILSFIAWQAHDDTGTRLGVRAIEFIDNFKITSTKEIDDLRLQGLLVIYREIDDHIDWKYLVHILEKGTELIESIADLLLEIGRAAGEELTPSRPILESIQFGSPGGVEIKIDFGVAEILKVIVESIQNLGLKRSRYRAETERITLENQRLSLENANLQVEVLRNALSLTSEAQTRQIKDDVIQKLIRQPLKQALQVDRLPSNLFEENSIERGILEKRVLPAAAEIMDGDDPTYQVRVSSKN